MAGSPGGGCLSQHSPSQQAKPTPTPNPHTSGSTPGEACLPRRRGEFPSYSPAAPLKENHFKASQDFSHGGSQLMEPLPV